MTLERAKDASPDPYMQKDGLNLASLGTPDLMRQLGRNGYISTDGKKESPEKVPGGTDTQDKSRPAEGLPKPAAGESKSVEQVDTPSNTSATSQKTASDVVRFLVTNQWTPDKAEAYVKTLTPGQLLQASEGLQGKESRPMFYGSSEPHIPGQGSRNEYTNAATACNFFAPKDGYVNFIADVPKSALYPRFNSGDTEFYEQSTGVKERKLPAGLPVYAIRKADFENILGRVREAGHLVTLTDQGVQFETVRPGHEAKVGEIVMEHVRANGIQPVARTTAFGTTEPFTPKPENNSPRSTTPRETNVMTREQRSPQPVPAEASAKSIPPEQKSTLPPLEVVTDSKSAAGSPLAEGEQMGLAKALELIEKNRHWKPNPDSKVQIVALLMGTHERLKNGGGNWTAAESASFAQMIQKYESGDRETTQKVHAALNLRLPSDGTRTTAATVARDDSKVNEIPTRPTGSDQVSPHPVVGLHERLSRLAPELAASPAAGNRLRDSLLEWGRSNRFNHPSLTEERFSVEFSKTEPAPRIRYTSQSGGAELAFVNGQFVDSRGRTVTKDDVGVKLILPDNLRTGDARNLAQAAYVQLQVVQTPFLQSESKVNVINLDVQRALDKSTFAPTDPALLRAHDGTGLTRTVSLTSGSLDAVVERTGVKVSEPGRTVLEGQVVRYVDMYRKQSELLAEELRQAEQKTGPGQQAEIERIKTGLAEAQEMHAKLTNQDPVVRGLAESKAQKAMETEMRALQAGSFGVRGRAVGLVHMLELVLNKGKHGVTTTPRVSPTGRPAR